ncbi:hypothetical protein WICPIJ_009089 [Wickerhamomyces pijperi]|uniref:Uncharacterized protein n=1 Tax=Wickerhamomyces pijperi TaxID=599730 RepID=A0A9P8PRY3_WICPI|nr:hypothetical protein WICPIJ_009089 [Wickerhamomyces pijperi]
MSQTLDWKENRPTTPTRSHEVTNPSLSPLHPATRNHSNINSPDHSKYPQPLPISPQMLKSSILKPLHPGSPKQVGKLPRSPSMEALDVEIQLKKILDSQSSLKSTVTLMNSSVKQTQIDLESLVQRSTNNNSHLKDLLQNVTTAANKAIGITEETLQSIITKATYDLLGALLKDEKADTLHESILSKLDSIVLNSKAESKEIASLLAKTLDELSHDKSTESALISLSEQIQSLQQQYTSLNEQIESQSKEIRALLEESKSNVSDDVFLKKLEIVESHSSTMTDGFSKMHSLIEKELKGSSVSSEQVMVLLFKLENVLIQQGDSIRLLADKESVSNAANDLKADLDGKSQQVLDGIQKLSLEFQESISLMNMNDSVKDLLDAHKTDIQCQLNNTLETLGNEFSKRMITEKELEIKLRDQEIAQLKKRLEDQEEKIQLSESIKELTRREVALEIKIEALENSYTAKYKELKDLAEEHHALNEKINQINKDKLKTMIASASVLVQSGPDRPESTTKSSGPRVFSTNSYLNNDKLLNTTKTKKSYNLTESDLVEHTDEHDMSF